MARISELHVLEIFYESTGRAREAVIIKNESSE